MTSKFWSNFAAPENVEICLDICLKEMGLEYVDLWLAHWPNAVNALPREALLKARAGSGATPEDEGQMYENGAPIIDWEHTSANIAKQCGMSFIYYLLASIHSSAHNCG